MGNSNSNNNKDDNNINEDNIINEDNFYNKKDSIYRVHIGKNDECAFLLRLNSETDFCLETDVVIEFLNYLSEVILEEKPKDKDELLSWNNNNIEHTLYELREELKENIEITEYEFIEKKKETNTIYAKSFVRKSLPRLGVITEIEHNIEPNVNINLSDEEIEVLVINIVTQILACPWIEVINREGLDKNFLNNELVLLEQVYIRDNSIKVKDYLKENNCKIIQCLLINDELKKLTR